MGTNPRQYPDTMISPESGRTMVRGEKLLSLRIQRRTFQYRQPGWWCSLEDPDYTDGRLVQEENVARQIARR